MKKIILLTLACSVFFAENILAQFPGCPAVSTPANVTIPCGQTCTDLTATPFGGAQTTAYTVSTIPYAPPFAFNTGTQVLVATDDLWSGVINLPFHFCFFGNNYNQVIVGSNGVASFNVANAGATNNWNIPGPIPSNAPADLTNCIMGPWQDIDPTNAGQIFYEIGGTAPCRYIKFSWYNVPYYGAANSVSTGSCPGQNLRATQQIILYETTNVIDMYIQQKQYCAAWNNGYATQGIQNAAGTVAYTVPGRNASVWSVLNDAKRFTPSGTPNYTIAWFQGATQIGTGTTINVCPPSATTYTAKATYTDCDGSTILVSSNTSVTFSGITANVDSIHPISCHGGSDGAVYASYSAGSTVLSYGWSPGGAGQTSLTGISAGTYVFSVTDAANCTRYDTAIVADPPQLVVNVPDTTLTSCAGNPTTSLTATPSGGTAGYTYSWTGGSNAQTITVGAGTYSVTVTDSKLCTASDAGTVSASTSSPTFNQPTITNATCLNNDGSISVSLTGAVPTVNYNWSNSLPNSATQTGLAAGTYTVTATDGNGCSVSASYTVGQPTPITFGAPTITGATCAGNNGSITVVVNGATPTVNYNWSNSLPNSDTQTGLAGGTYTVTATDANSCTATASYTVGQTASISFGAPVITNANCGGSNGTIVVTTIGATQPVDFNWSNSLPNNDTVTGLAAGAYSVTATDANGCSATASYNVGQGASFTFGTPVITNATCAGNDGSIVVTTNGATNPIDFNWSSGLPNNDTVTGLSVGSYSVTATDANGCSASASYNVGQGSSINITNASVNDISCAGFGSISITATGGTGTLTFSWSGPSGSLSGNPLSNLTAGTYNLTITDQGGCSATATYIVGTSPCGDCPAVSTNNNVTIPCGQTCTTLTATAIAGHQTTSYTGAAIAYNPAAAFNTGTPILVAIDDTWSNTINLPFNFCFFGNTYSQLIVGSNGIVSFNTANAGTGNSWAINNGIPSTTPADLRNCIMGPWQDLDPTFQGQIYYSIIGTYPCRQFVVSWYQVPMYGDPNSVSTGSCNNALFQTQQIALYETTNVIDVYIQDKGTCSGWNGGKAIEGIQNAAGTVAYTVPGRNGTVWTATNDAYRFTPAGAPNYVINWFQGNTQIGSGDSITVCPAATSNYTVQAVYTNCDNSTITVADSVHVTVQGGLTAAVDSFKNVSCLGNDGAVYASYTSTGGTVTSFGWSPGGANQTSMTGLPAGTYIFTVTNSGGCTVSDTVTLTAAPQLSVTVPDTTLYNCTAGVVTTSLTATASSGTPGYTYVWDNQQTGATITGVGAGTYNVTATDANGCTATDAGTITQQVANPTLNSVVTNITCNGANNGSIVVSVSQATPAIDYAWSGNLPNNDTVTNLSAGTYAVTATDANGCSVSASYDITEPAPIVIGQATITDASCTVGGTISVTATGGTGTLTYGWSNSDSGSSIDSLAAGPYDLTVTDANGCTATASYTVNAAPNTVAFGNPTIVDVTCNGGNNGSITVTATGGTGNITYNWGGGITTPTRTGLAAGSYSVTITDAVGCSASTTYTVNEPTAITLGNPTITAATCTVGGTVTVTASGGTGTLTYGWSNGDTGTTADSLAGGSVTLTVTDANSCSVTATYTVPSQGAISFGSSIVTNITCNGADNGSIHVVVTGGTPPVVYTWNPQVSTDSIASGLPQGSYDVTVTDAGGCSASTTYSIVEPAVVALGNATVVDATCSVGGSINVPASGGTGTLTYNWAGPNSTTFTGNPITGLSGGTYTLTVTDANQCSVTASYTVAGAAGAITFGTPTLTQPTCNGGTNGSITVTTTGGTGTIGYVWGGSSNVTATLSPIGAGTYSVTASDPNGCSSTASYTLGEPSAITFGQPDITPVTCSALGSIGVFPNGGTGTITLNWSNGDSGNFADSLSAGSVTVTATDASGCSATASYTIPTASGTLVFGTPIINNVSCNGAHDGSISVNATGGTGTVTFTWGTNPQQVGATITGLAPGTYTVTASDQGGCSVTASYTITEPAPLTVTVNATALLCFGDTTGSATADVTGGTPNYTYHWNQNQTTPTVNNLEVGIVLVTVTDANGCTAKDDAIIGQSPSLSYNSQVNQPTCADLGFGTEILTPRGGTGAIAISVTGIGNTTLSMVGADTVATFNNVPTGNYVFTLTDALGCKTTGNFFVNAGAANQAFDVETDSTSCYGDRYSNGAITLTPQTLANGPYSYSLNGVDFQTDSNFSNLTAGTYNVIVRNNYGCLDTVTAVVEQPAQVFVNATPDTIITGANVGNQVTVNAQNFVNPVYTWSPVTGLDCGSDTLTCTNPTITVDQSAVYYILVHEASDKSCAASDSVVIIVTGDLKMPNAFSPNGDGKNDTYGPVNGDHAAFTITDFRIYNRWGQLVHNALENWDGKIDGKDQPADTYIYYISVKAPDAANPGTMKTENSQGAFTLLR